MLTNCVTLTSLSVPWTTVRHVDAETWRTVLTGSGVPLASLELQCVDLTYEQAADKANQVDLEPLKSLHFSQLRRLKIIGDTNAMPITDSDLYTFAHTSTQLEEFHLTCNSSTTIDGVLAIVQASQNTLRVVEHCPSSHDGLLHPRSAINGKRKHLCDIFRRCPKLQTLSISLPSMCAHLFSNGTVKFSGDLQVRALGHCEHEGGWSREEATDAIQKLPEQGNSVLSWSEKGFTIKSRLD
jgi:hypothetical protein